MEYSLQLPEGSSSWTRQRVYLQSVLNKKIQWPSSINCIQKETWLRIYPERVSTIASLLALPVTISLWGEEMRIE